MTAQVVPIREPQRKRDVLKRLCQCIGLASILLVMNYGDLLGGGADVRMHVPFALTQICLAQLTDIVLLALLIFALVVPLERTRLYPAVRLILAMLLPPYILFRLQDLIPLLAQDGMLILLFVVWGAVVLVLYLRAKPWYRQLIRLADVTGIFLFVFAVFSMAQLVWVMAWRPGPYASHAAWARPGEPTRQHPRLVWIVFDELSYDQVFGDRAHDLALPNFDRLRGESTLYTNTQPIGSRTVKIIPSLLSGHVVDDVRFRFNNSFKVHYVGLHGWHDLDGRGTLFADAEQAGWRTAAVGWYNPYCTIYGAAIEDCYAMNLDRIDGDMAQRDGFWRNVYSPLVEMVREVKSPERADRDTCTYDVRQRLKTHLDLLDHATRELREDQSDFVFLHLPIPHSPNIWSRETDNYTAFCDSSYLDNLALADHVLGGVLDTLQASPRWKDTTVIVQGDHSWRMYLWNNMPSWTETDDAVSRRGFDPRPAVLIHRAGQTVPGTDTQPWSILNVHRVMEQVLSGGAGDSGIPHR